MSWAAAAGAVGGLVGNRVQARFNATESRRNREFQQYNADTQYQRAAVDLEAAGLNRVLALGSPAAQPSGAQASINAPDIVGAGVAAASAKQQIAQSKAKTKVEEATQDLITEQTRKTAAEASQAEFTKLLFDKALPFLETSVDNLLETDVSSVKDGIGSKASDVLNKLTPQSFFGLDQADGILKKAVKKFKNHSPTSSSSSNSKSKPKYNSAERRRRNRK